MSVRLGGYRALGVLAAMVLTGSAPAFAANPEVFTYDAKLEGAGTPVISGTYGASSSNATYTVTAGATYQLEVFLQSSAIPANSILQTNDEDGIFGAGAKLTVASGTGTLTNATIAFDNSTNASGDGFSSSFNKSSIAANAVTFAEAEANAPSPPDGVFFGNVGAPSDAGVSQIYLATITMQAPTSGTTVYKLGENQASGNITITANNGEDLDTGAGNSYGFTPVGSNFTSITMSIASTPEPSTMGLLAISGLFALKRRRRLA